MSEVGAVGAQDQILPASTTTSGSRSAAQPQGDAAVAVTKKAIDTQQQVGQAMVKLIDSTSQIGRNIDVWA